MDEKIHSNGIELCFDLCFDGAVVIGVRVKDVDEEGKVCIDSIAKTVDRSGGAMLQRNKL